MSDQNIYNGIFGSGVGLSLAPRSNVSGATFSGDGVKVTFTFPAEAPIISSSPHSYDVIIYGVGQIPVNDYTVNPETNTITFVEAPPAGTQNIYVRVITQAVSETESAAVTVNGYLTANPQPSPVPSFAGIGGPFNSQAQALLDNLAALGGIQQFASYEGLRGYTGGASAVDITGYLVTSKPSGIVGRFVLDGSDVVSADNGGTIIVDAMGRRWKRQYAGSLRFKWFGAKADGVTQDTAAVLAALEAAKLETRCVEDEGIFAVASTIRIPSGVVVSSLGGLTFKWVGATPEAGSKYPVVSCAAINPVTTAIKAKVTNFSINCAVTPNLVGIEYIYSSFMSKGSEIRVEDVGVDGIGHRFAKLWYASFEILSVRNSVKTAGSVAFMLDTGSIGTGEINGIKFTTLQSNKCSIGLLLDTTNYIYASEFDTLILEQGDVGVKHIGKKGVRQLTFQNVYLESNTIMVDWQKDAAATDTSSAVMWNNVQTQIGTSIWNIAEGRHWIQGCDSITTLNNTGAQIRIEGDGNIGTINNSGGGRTLVVRGPTQLPQGNAYASVFAKPQAAVAVRNVVAAATTVTTIPLPADLLNTAFPAYGREIKVLIYARKWSNTQNRYWEGYLVQRDNQTWGIFKTANASTEDATWSVTVNSTTGELTVTYTDTSEGKVVIAEYLPL